MLIREIAAGVQAGKQSAVTLVEQALERAEAVKDYHSLLYITRDRALARAHEIDERVAKGEKIGPLAGVPFINKDNIMAFDGPSTAASRVLEHYETPIQATVIERLEAAGAISIGKSNLDAFAHGSSTENSAFGPTKNAVDPTRVPGGSSGGSATAVALGIAPFALGTDTGGSIRQPASLSGVLGIKPTYGLVSRFGAVAMSSSTDCIGCFATESDDLDLVMSVISGRDQRDMTTYDSHYQLGAELPKSVRIGVIKQFMSSGVDPEVLASTELAIDQLKALGHQVSEVDVPEVKYALAIYYIVVSAEVASNLGRYDGVRYGYRTPDAQDDLQTMYGKSRGEAFESENKRRIMIGNYVLASGYFEAYYLKAQKVRTLLIDALKSAFKNYDFLVGPVTPEPAFKLGENSADPLKMYMADIMTTPANLAGIPAISVPSRPTKAGLPIGVQIMADTDRDAQLISLTKQLDLKLKEII